MIEHALRRTAQSRPAWADMLNAAADEIDRLRAEVARLTPPPPKPSAFARELATYEANRPNLLAEGCEGEYVVVKGDELYAGFATYDAALADGYRMFGLDGFMVKQVAAAEPVVVMRPTVVVMDDPRTP